MRKRGRVRKNEEECEEECEEESARKRVWERAERERERERIRSEYKIFHDLSKSHSFINTREGGSHILEPKSSQPKRVSLLPCSLAPEVKVFVFKSGIYFLFVICI